MNRAAQERVSALRVSVRRSFWGQQASHEASQAPAACKQITHAPPSAPETTLRAHPLPVDSSCTLSRHPVLYPCLMVLPLPILTPPHPTTSFILIAASALKTPRIPTTNVCATTPPAPSSDPSGAPGSTIACV